MQQSKETQVQIMQMKEFILNEAKDRAEEITTKALQEFSIEKIRIINQSKEKIDQEYAKKVKQLETQAAIARSTAINKSRLAKVKSRQEVIAKIAEDSKKKLESELKNDAKAKQFITNLIVQGLLLVLEDDVQVRCRKSDEALVQSCIEPAVQEYIKIVKNETGASKKCKLTLDKSRSLPPAPTANSHDGSCLGGIALACQNGSITIDNTIDSRLQLVMDQAKPTIRKLLFES